MHDDLEPVIERRFHASINFANGVWHAGQRNSNWIRISNAAKEAGFKFSDLGKILVHKVKEEFGGIATRVQATIITDEDELNRRLEEAKAAYDKRDDRMKGLKDDKVEDFYTCTMCQSFAPAHICVISPERIGLCGAINWLDAKAGFEIAPNGPNKPLKKDAIIDIDKGEFKGINDMISAASSGNIERICMYSMMDAPMTSCGCFEVIAAMTVDMQAVILVDRDFPGMTPVGMKFSTLAGSIGGGRQTPGFMGIGKKYITSEKFIAAEGGIVRIAWMPKHLKESIAEAFQKRCEESGVPDLMSKIADETITDDAEGLMAWMAQVEHPALNMPPLL
jgi:acetyl-CoA synthase